VLEALARLPRVRVDLLERDVSQLGRAAAHQHLETAAEAAP
jgi:hypothetical protein